MKNRIILVRNPSNSLIMINRNNFNRFLIMMQSKIKKNK